MVPLNSLISVQNSASFLFSSSSFTPHLFHSFSPNLSDYLDFWKSSQFQHTTNVIIDAVQKYLFKIGITETGTFYTYKCVTFLFSLFPFILLLYLVSEDTH
ncbi:hypothetical protein ACKWTF_012950 [Chironomus riparius]